MSSTSRNLRCGCVMGASRRVSWSPMTTFVEPTQLNTLSQSTRIVSFVDVRVLHGQSYRGLAPPRKANAQQTEEELPPKQAFVHHYHSQTKHELSIASAIHRNMEPELFSRTPNIKATLHASPMHLTRTPQASRLGLSVGPPPHDWRWPWSLVESAT